MLTKNQIINICKKQSFSARDTKYVLGVHTAMGPSRKPSGHFNSVHDVIASRKMKWTTDSEARSTELPFALYCEFSRHILGFYAQPNPIKIAYINKQGKKVTIMATFDFLVISENKISLVECKKEKELEKLIVNKPFLYSKTDNKYHYGKNDNFETSTDIPIEISTDRDYSTAFTRNCIYLFNFIDDFISNPCNFGERIAKSIRQSGNRLKLRELEEAYGQAAVIQALLKGDIYIEFDKDLLCHADYTWVYADKAYLEALRYIKQEYELFALSSLSEIHSQHNLWWNNQEWEIVDITDNNLTIRKDRRVINIEGSELKKLIRNQEIYIQVAPTDSYSESLETLSSYSPEAIERAIQKLAIARGRDLRGLRNTSNRTVRRWKALVKSAEKQGTDPLISLIPKDLDKGNRTSRLSPELTALINKVIKDDLLKPSPASRYSAFGNLAKHCSQQHLECCSLKTFYEKVALIPEHTRILRQKGFKAAYALGPEPYEIDLAWDLPYHGDYYFEVAHVDHTPLEIQLVSALTGEIINSSLTLSLLIDGYSRTILAIWVSFEKPSYRSTMMLLRECYRRHKRLPIFIATDKGSDFQSHYFSRVLANLGIHHRNRPTAQPRHGSVVERVFGIAETELVHTLEGNKQLQKLGRGLSPSHNPKKFAVLTPDEFYAELADYAYLYYPKRNRRSISERPIDRVQRSLSQFDEHPGVKVASQQSFYISTLPEPKDKEGFRTINKNQIEFRQTNYRLSERVRDYDGRKRSVKIKYDPYDPRYILAQFSSGWVKLLTNDHLIRECYDKGVRFPHLEVMPRKTRDGQRYRNDPLIAAKAFNGSLAIEDHHLREKQQKPEYENDHEKRLRPDSFSFNFDNIESSSSSTIKTRLNNE